MVNTATPQRIDEAIRRGAHSLHEIAGRIGVDPTDYTLRANLAAMCDGGYLGRVDTDAKLTDGRVNWQYDRAPDAELHVEAIEEIAQAGPSGLKQASYAPPADPMEERVLSNAAALDPADHSLGAEQVRETAASIRDHRRARTQEAEDARQRLFEGNVEYVTTKVDAAARTLATSHDRAEVAEALRKLGKTQIEQAARLAGCEVFTKGARTKAQMTANLVNHTAGARADFEAIREGVRVSSDRLTAEQRRVLDNAAPVDNAAAGADDGTPAARAQATVRGQQLVRLAEEVTTVEGLSRVLAEGRLLTTAIEQAAGVRYRATAESEDAATVARHALDAQPVYRAAAEAAPRVFDHDPTAARTIGMVADAADRYAEAAYRRSTAADEFAAAAKTEAQLAAALRAALLVADGYLDTHRRIAEVVTSTTSSDLDKYR